MDTRVFSLYSQLINQTFAERFVNGEIFMLSSSFQVSYKLYMYLNLCDAVSRSITNYLCYSEKSLTL